MSQTKSAAHAVESMRVIWNVQTDDDEGRTHHFVKRGCTCVALYWQRNGEWDGLILCFFQGLSNVSQMCEPNSTMCCVGAVAER